MKSDDTIYTGTKRGLGTAKVTVMRPGAAKPAPLRPRFDLRNHSPDGFEWGYPGSGPAQLALAMLADATDDEHAMANYQDFKAAVVARFADDWTMNAKAIRELTRYEAQPAQS